MRSAIVQSLRGVRRSNPDVGKSLLVAGLVAAAGYGAYRWWESSNAPVLKPPATAGREWVYWAQQDAEGRWLPYVESPDGSRPAAGASYETREEAEDAAQMFVEMNGGIPVLSDGAPGSDTGVSAGLEGAGAPTYVGSGWSWPYKNQFPTEASFLIALASLGYSVSGTSVLTTQNIAAVKKFQGEYNAVVKAFGIEALYANTNATLLPPTGLSVDGLIGGKTALAIAFALSVGESEAWWPELVSEAKAKVSLPSWVTRLIKLGRQWGGDHARYGRQQDWIQTGFTSSAAKDRVKNFQRDYNCIAQVPLVVDGSVGPKTLAAIAAAESLEKTWGTAWANVMADNCD